MTVAPAILGVDDVHVIDHYGASRLKRRKLAIRQLNTARRGRKEEKW
jgi:hypothetical protein